VGPLGLVELQGLRDAVDDAVGDAGGVAALQPGVVLAGDASQQGDLLAAQARDPPAVAAVGGQSGLLGADPGPSRAQELPDLRAEVAPGAAVEVAVLVAAGHVVHSTSAPTSLGVPASTPLTRVSHLPTAAGVVESAPPMMRWLTAEEQADQQKEGALA
jgi:hypothetical protein